MFIVPLVFSILIPFVTSQCDEVQIQSTGDISKANGCTKIGSLTINGEGLGTVELNNLQSVSDSIKISTTSTLNKVSMNKLESAKDIKIDNNSGLTSVSFSSLKSLDGSLFLSGNSPKIQFSAPKLATVTGDTTFSNATGIDVSGLSSVKSALSFSGNSFKNVSLSNLQDVGKSLSFDSNDQVQSVKFDKLQTIGGALLVANNTKLTSAEFPALTSVNGALDVNGALTNLDLSSLNEVKGGADIQSQSSSLSCESLNKLQAVVAGKFSCSDSSSSSSSSKKSTGSKSSKGGSSASSALGQTVFSGLISLTFIINGFLI